MIKAADFLFVRVERRYDKKTQHKLAPIVEFPFRVKEADETNKTVVIEREDRFTENLSRSRVTLAPPPILADDLIKDNHPKTDEELRTVVWDEKQTKVNQLVKPTPSRKSLKDPPKSINQGNGN